MTAMWNIFQDVLSNTEFWMGLSLLAAVLPGPQTRFLPGLFRALAKIVPKALSGQRDGGA